MEMQLNDNVLELTRKLGREPNVETALHIMQWELGDLTKSVVYMNWHPELAGAYREEAKHALSSLLFQATVVSELLEADFLELLQFGIDTVKDRRVDKEKKVGRFKHYTGGQKSE